MRPVLYFAITSHGFGHAVRTAAVAAKVQELNPDVLLILVTTVPHWLLETYISSDFIQRVKQLDVGVVQADSFKMDYAATLEKLQSLQQQERQIIADEVSFLKLNRVGLVLGDVPALAVPIAHAVGIPCWLMSNFGWDFIYRAWGGEFTAIADWMSHYYSQCDRLFRLPLNEPMESFSNITDVGLAGGDPRHSFQSLRDKFNLNQPPENTILLTFGGLGVQGIPYEVLQQFPDRLFITFDRQAPDLENLRKITDIRYRPVDFMPLCDRVVSKPGFSTFSEALRLDIPIATLPRNDFAEGPVLVEALSNYGYHQILNPNDFYQGHWDFLQDEPQPPKLDRVLNTNGVEAIAAAIIEYFRYL